MNSPLLPTPGHVGPATRTSSANPDDASAFAAELGAQRPLTIGARTAGPPSELLEQMSEAAGLQQQLRERGEELRFSKPGPGERVAITLHDTAAIAPRRVSVTEAFAIAAGETSE